VDKCEFLQEQREIRRKKALEEHRRMSSLFRENRFAFERQRREAIKKLIESVPDPGLQKRLWETQARWDRIMKSAGSPHNRFVLAKALFWDHVINNWVPALTAVADSTAEQD